MYALDLQGAAGVLSGEDAEVAGNGDAVARAGHPRRRRNRRDHAQHHRRARARLPGDIRVDKDVPFNKIPTKGRA